MKEAHGLHGYAESKMNDINGPYGSVYSSSSKKFARSQASDAKKDAKELHKKATKLSKTFEKGITMNEKNLDLAKTITADLVEEFPELVKSVETEEDMDLLKGLKLDAKQADVEMLNGLHHHVRNAHYHKRSMKSHDDRAKSMPSLKDACDKHCDMAKKYAKKLGVPEKEINELIENGRKETSLSNPSSYSSHYSDKMLEKSEGY